MKLALSLALVFSAPLAALAGGVNCRPPYCGSPIDCHPCDQDEAPLATENGRERNVTPVDETTRPLDLILGEMSAELS